MQHRHKQSIITAQVMHLGLLLLPTHPVSSSKASKDAMKGTVFVHYSEYKNEGTLLSHHQAALVPFVFSSDISQKTLERESDDFLTLESC